MRLLMFEHCSLCFRVRMIAALKGIRLEEQVVIDDDDDAMVSLVGRRVIPILVMDDNTPMLESMDMVEYIEAMGSPALVGNERPEMTAMEDELLSRTPNLTMPRYSRLDLPEFATPSARAHFIQRKMKTYRDFDDLIAETPAFIEALMPSLEKLDRMIESETAVNGMLSRDDIRILPILRSLGVVKNLEWPSRVRSYTETMMSRLGFQPLPQI
ncbi:MAG: GrxB family glutaredoxin [Pseudomonadota bacterium]